MATATTASIDKAIRALGKVRKSAIPQAARATINTLAFNTRRLAQKNITRLFIERNQYTRRGVTVRRAVQRNIGDMQAGVGHASTYMAQQEVGAQARARGQYKWVALPGGRVGSSWRRMPRRKYYRGSVGIVGGTTTRHYRSRRARSVAEMMVAKRTGKLIMRGRGSTRTLLRVAAIRRAAAGGVRARLQPVYQLNPPGYRVKARPWLTPAARVATKPARVAAVFTQEANRILAKGR